MTRHGASGMLTGMKITLVLPLMFALANCGDEAKFSRVAHAIDVSDNVDFGTGYVGFASSGKITIRATDQGTIRVVGVSASVADVVIASVDTVFDVRVGQPTEVPLVWTPSHEGELVGEVRVFTQIDAGEVWHVALSGRAKPVPSCFDGNDCTDDGFNVTTGRCRHDFHSEPCDDGSKCTDHDRCHEGVCRGVGKTCDDESICTRDTCDPMIGCVWLEDPSVCVDTDPCTLNKCSKEEGCLFPEAPDGTVCGTDVSCAELDVCLGGDCETIDISGHSDGQACSDNDACTDGDVCFDGECLPGPQLSLTPDVIRQVETFGGPGSFVASDGFRYLFVDNDGTLKLTSFEGDELVYRSTLPSNLVKPLPPLSPVPGAFLLVAETGLLSSLDANDIDTPVFLWSTQIVDPVPPTPAYTDSTARVTQAAWMTGGLVVAVEFSYTDGDILVQEGGGVLWLPMSPSTEPGIAVVISDDRPVVDLDASANVVAWGTDATLEWRYLNTDGSTAEFASRPWHGEALSVLGRKVAWLASGEVRIDEVDGDSSFVPYASYDFFAQLTPSSDLVLWESTLFVLRDELPLGMFSVPVVAGAASQVVPSIADTMPGNRVERGDGQLHVHGDLALPLRRSPSAAEGELVRTTGVGHGAITTLVAAEGTGLIMAGPTTLALYDTELLVGVGWQTRWGSGWRTPPWLIKGATRFAVVQSELTARAVPWGPDCEGTLGEIIEWGAPAMPTPLCRLQPGVSLATVSARLWAFGPESAEPDARNLLRAWDLRSAESAGVMPTIEGDLFAAAQGTLSRTQLSAATSGIELVATSLLVNEDFEESIQVDVFAALAGALEPPRTLEIPCVMVDCAQQTDPKHLRVDGVWLLVAVPQEVVLYDFLEDSGLPVATMGIANASDEEMPRVLSMVGGRAWLAWSDDSGSVLLRQVEYGDNTLVNVGEVALPAMPTAAWDAGNVVVLATPKATVVVRPACIR